MFAFAETPATNTEGFESRSSGLKVLDETEGQGTVAESGKYVTVHYTGTLFPSGKKFDSSVDRGDPFSFRLGMGRVIPGWEEGVVGMKVGGRRVLIIPPELAYGASGVSPVIPPNATLRFEVELLEVK
ncbi:MAG: FKBP-type peptidyl-prolyl cis-trans isomerase [Candidatus Melainabacteria bacterium]|nr:FKBP-type peptidyl-prolyl cis-trans isomerase [Candidatus Melainabacteria bacterium]